MRSQPFSLSWSLLEYTNNSNSRRLAHGGYAKMRALEDQTPQVWSRLEVAIKGGKEYCRKSLVAVKMYSPIIPSPPTTSEPL
jgi:hypothetical protein